MITVRIVYKTRYILSILACMHIYSASINLADKRLKQVQCALWERKQNNYWWHRKMHLFIDAKIVMHI